MSEKATLTAGDALLISSLAFAGKAILTASLGYACGSILTIFITSPTIEIISFRLYYFGHIKKT